MPFLPSCYAAKNQAAGQNVVAAIGERLLEGDNGKVHMVGQEMEAEEQCGKVGGEKDVDNVC